MSFFASDKFQLDLTLYQLASIKKAITQFENLCDISLSEPTKNSVDVTIIMKDQSVSDEELIKGEFLNFALGDSFAVEEQ